MITVIKGISSGTTALLHDGPAPDQQTISALLDPVRGLGADLFVAHDPRVRAFTSETELPPPSAILRLVAAVRHAHTPDLSSWVLEVDAGEVPIEYADGEYLMNHGGWEYAGGADAETEGHDSVIKFAGLDDPRPALTIRVGGRTVTVAAVTDSDELGSIELRVPPQTDSGASLIGGMAIMGERNVDLTDETGAVVGTQKMGALQLRGYDTTAGEIYSADALAIACAAAARAWLGEGAAHEWVAVFGGGSTRVVLGEQALASAEAEIFATASWNPPV